MNTAEACATPTLFSPCMLTSLRKKPALISCRTKACVTRIPLTDSARVEVTRLQVSCILRNCCATSRRYRSLISQISGTNNSMIEKSFQLYHTISNAATVIWTAWIVTTNTTSCTATRTLSISEVIRLMMRPNLVLLKNDMGIEVSLRNRSERMSWAMASPNSSASRWRKCSVTTIVNANAR